ncbi:non-ribosomal peptide synthetase [Chitinophaga nivalis]|uniref:Amino acid adenylation domain-containing protein n=1 Tax=Chitinophaga nivalis TaxID=2991709 RepID=A0ABT3IJ21_9BACT|nr:non-ribosomal peptide synthetase [Chitinophaga nivalis]MCW3466342.1 amino acid adenylation domain-containing protein [Chitinophaga nivalis]MCW3483967.1 amino acid adenylation domain-containing protein [Chitinophaga nivalis]
MSIANLLKRLKENNIGVALAGTDLEINFEGELLPDPLLQEIRSNKKELIDFLSTSSAMIEADGIPVAPVLDGYVLSSPQRRSWIASQFDESNTTYNMPGVYIFDGPLKKDALEVAFQTVIERHESLRTIFKEDENDVLKQFVQPASSVAFKIDYRDFRAVEKSEEKIRALVTEEILKPFDLVTGPIIRANLYQVEESKYVFMYVTHHIIADGWSMGVLFKELLAVYNAYIQGAPNPLQPLRIHYKDYAHWQQAHIRTEIFKTHREYWLKQFEGELPLLELPADKPRPLVKSYRAGSVTRFLDARQTKAIKALCRSNGGTLFMGLLSIMKTLLYRYTNQTDLIVGFPIASRDYVELEEQVGFYVNTLALRSTFNGSDTFKQLFKNIKQVTLNAFEHQQYPFDELVDELQVHRDTGRNLMIDAMVILQKTEIYADAQELNFGDVAVELYEGGENPFTPFDVLFNFNDLGDEIKMRIEYNTDIFFESTAVRMAGHYLQILEVLLTGVDIPLNQIPLLNEAEQQEVLQSFNNLQVNTPQPPAPAPVAAKKQLDFGLFYFGNEEEGTDKYTLLFEGAKYADAHGYTAVWTPERHFNRFGGPYPNPAVLGAALAAITKNIAIRAGSVVIPLHSPLRVAEEWSIVDNISGGRVGIACASGWNVSDFVLSPGNHKHRHQHMYDGLDAIKKLWRGEAVSFKDGNGDLSPTQIYPKPVQKELSLWISSAGRIETFIAAGKMGAGILTNMLNGTLEDVAVKINAYRQAYKENGHEPGKDRVVLMLHAYLGEDLEATYAKAKAPFISYLSGSLDLAKNFAASAAPDLATEQFTPDDLQDMLEYSYHRYVTTASLVGTKASCHEILHKVSEIGVDEIACLIDFGIDIPAAMKSLDLLTELRDEFNAGAAPAAPAPAQVAAPVIPAPAVVPVADTFDRTLTVIDLFEQQVTKTPDHIAVISGKRKLTYLQLHERSNQLAHYLRQTYQVQPNDLIGIQLERNEWMIVAILGVLKSGAAYVPIDPEYPQERISYMIADSGCKVLIDDAELATFRGEADQYPWDNPASHSGPDNLAYVIYTSGSTGKPKGVTVPHGNLHHFIDHVIGHLTQHEPVVVPFIASYAFDISLLQLFTPLLSGGTSVVVDKEQLQDMHRFAEILKTVDFIDAVPGVFNLLINHIQDNNLTGSYGHIKRIFVGGDAVPDSLLYNLSQVFPAASIGISYGPTEGTIFCTHLSHPAGTITPATRGAVLGRAISRAEIYILNEALVLAPLSVTGEICIGGPGVASGYLNQPELTADRFVDNPFRPGEKMYRTGDLGKWIVDGQVEFMGRKDAQIKIRGYRIELGEIESSLERHEEIEAAVVIAKANRDGEKELIAYVVGEESLDTAALRDYLGERLPVYMLPAYFIRLDALPLTPNGKVDRKGLPDPDSIGITSDVEYVAPRTEIETTLVRIWQDILRKEKVGVKDDFFHLGGHSLKATRLASQIYKELGVKLAIKDLFAKNTPEQQAELVRLGQLGQHSSYFDMPAAGAQESYPLSSSQRRLWILSQFEDGNVAYNMPGVYVFGGKLDIPAFERAFISMMERHEILRTVFQLDDAGEIRQIIKHPEATGFHIRQLDLRQTPDQINALTELVKASHLKAFDLAAGPLIRADLFRIEDNKWVFNYVIHHILTDGWSMGILMHELLRYYNAHLRNETLELPPLRIQYKDYAAWQQEQIKGEWLHTHEAYWLKQFAGELPVFELPGSHPRPPVKTYRGGRLTRFIDPKIGEAIAALNQENSSTLFMALQAIVGILLHRYTQQDDLIIGSPIASREHADLEDQIGFYLNTLPLRLRFNGDMSYRQLLADVRQLTLDGYEHQLYPFDELVDKLQLRRDMSRSAMFDVMIILQNTENKLPTIIQELGELEVTAYENDMYVLSMFDLSFEFGEAEAGLKLDLSYNGDIYEHAVIEQMADHLEQLITAILAAPDQSIAQLDFLGSREKEQLQAFNHTTVAYPASETITDLFTAQAAATPHQTALLSDDRSFTYQELAQQSNQLAAYLRKQYAIQPGDRIGIKTGRDEGMILAILGALKSGGAYVPVDPAYPQERIDYILADSQCKVVLDAAELARFRQEAAQYPADNLVKVHQPEDLAYVIYTSGSTGAPKGVMITHANAAAFIHWSIDEFQEDVDVVFGVTSMCFDLSVFEIFYPLTTGKQLRLLPDALSVPQYLQTDQRILLNTVPGVVNALLKEQTDLSAVRVLNLAGEPIPANCVAALDYRHMTVRNLYGPTETTTYSTVYRITGNGPVLIGRPIANTRIHITGENGQLQPIGVPGEICISGAGVTNGYLHQPALTAEKFVADPFDAAKKMYRTGDLGYWLPDGNIALIGRKDNQVKIHGYRIETGEIENTLLKHPAITEAVVAVPVNREGDKELIAYFTARESITPVDIREWLGQQLPAFMVPRYYVQLEALPLLPNGKTDRKNLVLPADLAALSGVEYIAPRNEQEAAMVAIWQELLGKDKISVKDNFFELGGHSLKATRLASQIYKKMGVKVAIKDLLAKNTLEQLVTLVRQGIPTAYISIPEAGAQESYPLSSSQRRLWILSQFEEGNIAYNMSGVYVFGGKLDIPALEQAFHSLAIRHEILRTVFKTNEAGEVRQFIQEPEANGFSIHQVDLRQTPDQENALIELVKASQLQAFDLETGPLVRAELFRIADNKWVFNYVIHHILSDAWSMGILIQELFGYYNAHLRKEKLALPPLRIQYKDYAVWQQEQLAGNWLQTHEAYWLKQFAGELPVFELPGSNPRPPVKTYRSGKTTRFISKELIKGIKALNQQQGSTLFMALQSAIGILLHRYTQQEDLIIGSPIANREHADLEDQIGFYLNTLPLRLRMNGHMSYLELLAEVRQLSLDGYEHQRYPFDELVDKLQLKRDTSRSALFDVMVILQNAETNISAVKKQLGELEITGYENEGYHLSKFDLSFEFGETEAGLRLDLVYNGDIYEKTIITQLLNHFEQLLTAIVSAPEQPVGQLDFLSGNERESLLQTFNNTSVVYPTGETITDLFTAQAAATPHQTALLSDDRSLTYQELEQQSNQLAAYLRKQYAIQPGDLIGIKTGRHEGMVIAILGALKSGGAYVPIDPAYPQERIDYILADSQCKVVLDELELERFSREAAQYPADSLAKVHQPEDLAYVIYTSGSTGTPKGVMITHANAAAFIHWSIDEFQEVIDVVFGVTSISFDLSVFEIFYPLTTGKQLRLLTDALSVTQYLQTEQRILLNTVPSVVNALLKEQTDLSAVRVLNMAGEPIPAAVVSALNYEQMTVRNLYGPTETTTYSTVYRITGNGPVLIGHPIANTKIRITGENGQLQPIGVPGEICISGAGVTKGYLHQPALTTEKFVADPFEAGKKMYRTGDLGYWLPDGNIALIGRKDNQVKIHGYRIETGEVENTLRKHPAITGAVVVTHAQQEDGKELVAYFTGKQNLTATDIRAWLLQHLPAFMVPRYYVQLQTLPLLPNGKTDRKNLPLPEGLAVLAGVEYVAPRNPLEEKMVAVWEELLAKKKVGIKDNFFDLGGHSLKVIRLLARISKDYGVKINIQHIFTEPTVENLCAHLAFIIDQRDQKQQRDGFIEIDL